MVTPDKNLCDKIISAVRQEKEKRKKKMRLVVVLSSILLIALLVLVFSMGVLIGQNQEEVSLIYREG